MGDKLFLNVFVVFLFLGGSIISTPQTAGKNSNTKEKVLVNLEIPEEKINEFENLKDSIISCVDAAERSKQVISLNEPYLRNLQKKIEKIEQQK